MSSKRKESAYMKKRKTKKTTGLTKEQVMKKKLKKIQKINKRTDKNKLKKI